MTQSATHKIVSAPAQTLAALLRGMCDKDRAQPALLRDAACAIVYIAAYWLLSQASIFSSFGTLGIAIWNPSTAPSIILLFMRGSAWSPLAFIAAFSSQLLFQHIDMPLYVPIATAAGEALIYTAAVWLMKTRFGIDAALGSLRDVIVFAAGATAAAAVMAIFYTLIHYAAGIVSARAAWPLVAEYWTADALGSLIVVPLFLVNWQAMKTAGRTRLRFSFEAAAQLFFAGGIVLCAQLMEQHGIHVFYMFFIPVLWVAVRNGLVRVAPVLLVMQASIVLCSWKVAISPAVTVQFMPFIMLVISWTGLILGSVIDEKEQVKLSNMKNDARLKAILNMAPDCMLIVDMKGHVVTANRNFTQLYGAEKPEAIAGMPIAKIVPTFYPDLNGETFLLLADGKDIPIEISSSKVPVGDKFSSILTVRDITNRKRAETQIRQRRAVTEQATRANLTGGLAAVLAHELNQPLSAIMSYASACARIVATADHPPPRVAEQLEKVTLQAKRAGDIIKRLREFFQNSNIEAAKTDIAELVNEALLLLEDEIIQSQVDVEVHLAKPLTAAIDRVQIEQVLMNLIKNSLEALREVPKDQKRIRITGALSMRGDIEMTVSDTGPGIAPEIADQLFSPFVTTRLTGMGLGLTISRSIIEAHNGRLWAELQSSSGAALHFTIPAFQEA